MTSSSDAPVPIPVSIITGFLGSGKTTLLSKLLSHPVASNVAVIINEIGVIPLDHLIVFSPAPETYVLAGGCICCSIHIDFANTFRTLLESRSNSATPYFERVIVETTGIADPVSIVSCISSDPLLSTCFSVDGVITVVDGVNGLDQLKSHKEVVKQVKLADRIVISKVDIAERPLLSELRCELMRLNPYAEISESQNGEIGALQLINMRPSGARSTPGHFTRWLGAELQPRNMTNSRKEPSRFELAGHDGIHSKSLFYDGRITWPGVAAWTTLLSTFKAFGLLRVKALLNVAGDPVVVQGVQHVFYQPQVLKAWPTAERRSQIVFIFQDIDEHDLVQTVDAFKLELSLRQSTSHTIDPKVYGHFLDLVIRLRNGGILGSNNLTQSRGQDQ